ncbi:hypothetical protein OG21DRAFT_1184758 [Imleria badia]|nr:hypothetical protein OG21DRAFT_1184758 [Imleria badia]
MNSDATEAALGLLGLSPLNAPHSHPQPQPHSHHHVAHPHGPSLTSSTVGIAVDRTSVPPLIHSASLVPLKRKLPSPALSPATATPLTPAFSSDAPSTKPRQSSHPLATSSTPPITVNRPLPTVSTKSLTAPAQRQRPFSPTLSCSVLPQTPPTSQLPLPSPSTSQHPLALSDVPPPPDSDAISCICGFTYDDGFSIACDDCSRWCHAACFGIIQGGEVPEFWKCWVCDPALVVDKERAVKTQKGRLKAMRLKASHGANGASGATGVNGIGGSSAVDEGNGSGGKPTSRRKTSPGAERKSRRGSAVAAAIEGSGPSRKKRRASMLSPTNPSSPSIPPTNHASTQPHAGSSRISHPNDIYPNPAIYAQLLRVAKAWRGVTALNPPSPLIHPPPRTYNDGGYTRVDSQGYRDQYGYSMSPLDNTTPVIVDENAGDVFVPRTVLRTDPSMSCSSVHSGLHSQYLPPSTTCTPAHLRPPSPRLHVASDPSPFPHTSIYPSPPISNYMSTPVPSSSQHARSYVKSPLTPSTNTISSSYPNDTIPATTLLAPYTSAIVPSAAYLADPLNGYAHLGMGKPQVRLVGGGWEAGLDARGVGGVPDPPDSGEKGNGPSAVKDDEDGKARWARCGCWPNAVVRPVICNGKRGERKKGEGMWHKAGCAKAASDATTVPEAAGPPPTANGTSVPPPMPRAQGQQTDESSSDQDDAPSMSDPDADPTTLSFALFALRDLRADEEIVLGWEWDDGHAVHMLPALMESPGMFAPAHLRHLRAQFTSILHALSSTFTTCACGASTRDCAVRVMERVVEGRWPWPGGEMTSEGSEGDLSDVNGASEEWDDGEGRDVDVEGDGQSEPFPSRNWGLGMNVDVDIEMDASIEVDGRTRQVKKRKVRKKSRAEDVTHVNGSAAASSSTLKPKTKEAVDLGPLVGVKRGFRTREKAPMNGGWGGVEIVPSSLKAFPQVSAEEDPHVGGKGKGKARVADDDTDPALPPRMRKAWPRPPAGQSELSQENPPRDCSTRSESWRAHERWRSPPDMNVESPISVSGPTEGGSGSGKGGDGKQGSASMNGDGEDGADGQETEFDTETEADGLDDTLQMPPPPMPASLDPTTVSSLAHAHAGRSVSPRGSIQWDKNGVPATRIPPQTQASTSASSGRSGQPPSQGTFSAPPAPPNSTISRSLAPSQVNYGTLSPSTSFPLAHPPPSVSPSATFSKLSLHSPDVSSSPNLSVLCGPGESTMPSSASAPTLRASDHRAPSPPHRPSKPLHVHPQNESPSLAASLSAPVATLQSSDGTRDTPAEAQHQQPHRSPSELRHGAHPSSDVEKRRPSNGETYRVRFASPEILSGMPRLKGRVTSDSLEPLDAHDGVSDNVNAIGALEEQEVPPLDRDVMDVEVDVVGDNQREDGSVPSDVTSAESRMDDVLGDEYSSLPAPGSPPPPPDSRSHSILSVEDGSPQGNDPSQTASDVNETMSQAEPMAVDSAPTQPARDPSPPPPPKVKMSLKDFALRKKKQREEEMAKSVGSPVTPDGLALPLSPNVDVKRDLASEHVDGLSTADSGEVVNGQDVKMNDATKEDALDSSGTAHVAANGGSMHGHDARLIEESAAEDDKTRTPTMTIATKAPDTQQSPTLLLRVLGERNNDQTQMQIDAKPPMTLTAKMEILDAVVLSGLVGADDDPPPNVVSFAPEPPPPPLTTKQTSETATTDHTVPVGPIPRSAIPLIPTSTSTPTSMSTSTSTSAVNSRSNSVGLPVSTPIPNLHAHVPSSSSSIPSSRRPSHEDGEITSSTPPKAYLPRSHTPPTQPRSFHAVHPSSPSLGPTLSSTPPVARRPVPPLSRSPLSNNAVPIPTPAPISSRPLPSGPRALRGSMSQPTHPYASSPRPPYTGSQYIPRGPSADRDRMDWERGDRQWAAQTRSRGRAGSNGWGR